MNSKFKIFHRIFALLCCISFIPVLFAVPASAEEMTGFMDLVDAGYFSARHKVTADQNAIKFSFDEPTLIRYIDFCFTRSGTSPSAIYIVSGTDNSSNRLRLVSLGNNVYRAYGEVTVSISYDFFFKFDTTGTTWIYPYTCRASFNIRSAFSDVGYIIASDYMNQNVRVDMVSSDTPLYFDFAYQNVYGNSYINNYSAGVFFDDWDKYDFMDIFLIVNNADVSSLSCYIDNNFTYVPFDINIIGDIDLFQYVPNESGGVIRYFPEGLENVVYVNLRVDLTQSYRTHAAPLCVALSGQYSTEDSSLCLFSVTGYVSKQVDNTDTLWIKLQRFFSSLFNPEGTKDDAENFESEVTEKNEELNEMTEVMESVEKPNVDDINMEVGSYVDPAALAVSTKGLSSILGNEVILRVLILSLTMATVGYVLFGKR